MPAVADLRLFIAVHCSPTPALRQALGYLESLRPLVTPAKPDRLHITLRFLGQTPEDERPAIAAAIDAAVAMAEVEPFELHLQGVGRFPASPRRPPRTIFARMANPEPLLKLDEALGLALPPAQPPIKPHLTLGRVKPPRKTRRPRRTPRYQRDQPQPLHPYEEIDQFLEDEATTDFGSVPIEAVYLYSSVLAPEGAVHTVEHASVLRPQGSTSQ